MPSSFGTPDPAVSGDARAVDQKRFRWLLWALYKVSSELERMFPGRSFMPEGTIADSLAESAAEAHYDVGSLLHGNAEYPHALVVKAAQGGKVWLDSSPEHLLVLRLFRNGSFEEVYNGPGELAWELVEAEARRAKGPWAVKLQVLRGAMEIAADEERIVQQGTSTRSKTIAMSDDIARLSPAGTTTLESQFRFTKHERFPSHLS